MLSSISDTARLWRLAAIAAAGLGLAACGSGGSGGEPPPSAGTPAAECDPADPATSEECGTVFVGFTDADGDFVTYTVDVLSLTLEKANGAVVETLPQSTRIDFAEYVDLTEFITAASVPPGTYVAGSITVSYADAELAVESAGEAVEAIAVDENGDLLETVELEVRLPEQDRLVVTRGRPSLLSVDFDLEASHEVDLSTDPALATVSPFIVAEIDPVDEKDLRVRGPLVSVDLAESSYTVALRPWHRRDGDFGRVEVNVTGDTVYTIDGEGFTGAPGLEALDAAGQGTPTVAIGVLDVEAREFTAAEVLAGDSVPGIDADAVRGHVIARDGDELIVRGATVVPTDRRAFFNDNVLVLIGPETRVFKNGSPDELLDASAISVGQLVLVRGVVTTPLTDNDTTNVTDLITVDATDGRVRMFQTRLSGTVNQAITGQVDVDLSSIGRRRVGIFDFSGTGMSPDQDADPDNYEIATGALDISDALPGTPIRAFGFPAPFGFAPPDFEGRTLIDFTEVRAKLGIGWGESGETAPFLSIGPDGLAVDIDVIPDDARHYIRQGPVLIDVKSLAGLSIVPAAGKRTLFGIRSRDSLQLFADFDEFSAALAAALDGATPARSMHAHGDFDAAAGTFTARKLWIHLLEAE